MFNYKARTLLPERMPRNNHSRVVQGLGSAIVSGEFSEGQTLPGDQELAEQFKVSRTVLREAMKTLSAKGLVVPKARVGTRVTASDNWNLFDPDILSWYLERGIDAVFLRSVFEMRMAMEPSVAALAAERCDETQKHRLADIVGELGNPLRGAQGFVENSLRFHQQIADCTRNPFMKTTVNLVKVTLSGLIRLLDQNMIDEESCDRMTAAHAVLAGAIGARDAVAAREAMQTLLTMTRDVTLAAIRRGGLK